MSTTVHIPAALLKRIDLRAKAMGLSRNKLIVRTLAKELESGSEWPPEFLKELASFSPSAELEEAGNIMLDHIRARRSSKREPPF